MTVTINGTSTAVIPNASGNVGVGTASPNATGWGRAITVNGAASTNGAVELTENGTLRGYMSYSVGGGLNVYAAAGQFLSFGSNATEAVRIDASGNVSIGTTGVGSAGLTLSAGNNISWFETTNQSIANLFRQSSSAATVLANGYKFSSTANGFASSYSSALLKSAVSLDNGFIKFFTDTATTVAAGTDITPTERARITSSGDLCVGTTSSGGYKLRVDGTTGAYVTTTGANTAIYGYNSSTGIGVYGYSISNYGMYGLAGNTYGIYGQSGNSGYGGVIGYAQNGFNYGIIGYANAWALYGTGSAYVSGTYQGSDERLKENIQDLGNSLDKIAQLRAVTFDWKPNTDASLNGTYADVGLIAQEAINVLPNIVKETTAPPVLEGKTPTLNQELGTFYTIDYGKLIPYMVDAIQELKQQNDALAARVAALEAK